MKSKRKRIPSSSVYAVIDREVCARKTLTSIARGCIKGGVKIIQLRDKTENISRFYSDALMLRKIIGREALFIINDRADIAKLVAADGLHLGQDDIPIKPARGLLGSEAIIGKSCHSLQQAIAAQKEGADYISIGPIFSTPTKPDYKAVGLKLLRKVQGCIQIPIVAIGGINKDTISLVRKTGARYSAVVRALCGARNTVQALKELGCYL